MKHLMAKQGTAVWLGLIALCCGSLFLLSTRGWQPANPQMIRNVYSMAKENPAALKLLTDALKEKPNPTRGELRDIERQVNKILEPDPS